MQSNNNITVIGIGHEARQGKDTSASYLKSLIGDNAYILHFSDALYREVNNKHRKFPLIEVLYNDNEIKYQINTIDDETGNVLYSDVYSKTEVPRLHKMFLKKSKLSDQLYDHEIFMYLLHDNNVQFWGQDRKMPLMLQFWGTDFRREKYTDDYWINRTFSDIKKIVDNNDDNKHLYFLIPDTRFPNEHNFIKSFKNSHTIKVIRMISDDKQYVDPNRDPNHPSEASLRGFNFDYTISAMNVDELFSKLDNLYKNVFMETK